MFCPVLPRISSSIFSSFKRISFFLPEEILLRIMVPSFIETSSGSKVNPASLSIAFMTVSLANVSLPKDFKNRPSKDERSFIQGYERFMGITRYINDESPAPFISIGRACPLNLILSVSAGIAWKQSVKYL